MRMRAGFAIAPILYMLGLIGVVAGVMFSNNMQVLKTNIAIHNVEQIKNELNSNATTMAAESVLGADGLTLCVPRGATASSECGGGNVDVGLVALSTLSGNAALPSGATNASSTGSPYEVGGFAAGAFKQTDAYGHFYIVCRWENQTSSPSSPAFTIMSAGPDGTLQTKCGDTTAKGDDQILSETVAVARNGSSIWAQNGTNTTYGGASNNATFTPNGDLTLTGNLSVGGTSTLTGAVTASSGITSTTGTFSSYISAESGAFLTGAGGSFSAANGAMNVGSGGSLNAANGVFTVGSAGDLAIGTNSFTVTAATGDTAIAGTLSAIGTTTLGTSSAPTAASLETYGMVNIGTTEAPQTVVPYLTVGKSTGSNVFPFMVDTAGDVTAANFYGNFIGGTVSASSITDSGSLTAGSIVDHGTLAVTGNTTGSNATYSGTVTAAHFVGDGSGLTGVGLGTGGSVSGVLPIANGGTSANNAAQALINLGGNNANNITTGTLSYQRLDTTGIASVGGPFNNVFVDAYGRVTSASYVNYVSNGNNSVAVGTNEITFIINNVVQDNITTTGTMIGTSTVAKNKLDVYGAGAIGTGYAGVDTAPANGLIVEGSTAIGTATPVSGAALTVNGTVAATTFFGNGSGLTGIGGSSISGFTQGSVIFASSSGGLTQDNSKFFWDDTNHRLGIGTSAPARALDIDSNGALRLENAGNGIEFLQSSATDWELAQVGTNTSFSFNGNVGIGTNAPTNTLDVNVGSSMAGMQVDSSSQ
ncbi:MAG: hypothetical protein KGI97_05900, partial [Alphaproteobacteria bacterium]|nr:hypothetical protein [Alphaproteobacteria bacterium]